MQLAEDLDAVNLVKQMRETRLVMEALLNSRHVSMLKL